MITRVGFVVVIVVVILSAIGTRDWGWALEVWVGQRDYQVNGKTQN